jgi:hypothetical protein
MKKLLLLVLLLGISVHANSKESCYTVQLISKYSTNESKKELSEVDYPSSCKVMEIGKTLTVRCGCFDRKLSAKESLKELKKEYTNAIVSSTYRYRFDDLKEETPKQEVTLVEKQIIEPVDKIEKKIKEEKPKQKVKEEKQKLEIKDKPTCYTVQLISLENSRKSLNILSESNYPSSCKLMEIGNSYTVRCGCYDSKMEAKKHYEELNGNYMNAVVARTYKYRFQVKSQDQNSSVVKKDSKKSDKKVKVVENKDIKTQSKKMLHLSKEDEELRLILQVFLYKGDLENAYKVATIGYNKAPNAYYWNQKLAEIARWTNRSSESMLHLRKMYNIRYDEKIEKELIDFGVSAYQYEEIEDLVINKARKNPTEKNIDLMIFVYKQIGNPEKVVTVLEEQYREKRDPIFITKALALSLEIGDLEKSEELVNILESNKPYTQKDAALIANYYYIEHDIEKSYKSLNYVSRLNITDKDDYVKYFELKSDLGWYLQDNVNAAKASQELMRLEKARLVDYERIAYVYKETNPKLAGESSRDAYLKYKLSYLFYSYANYAINIKQFTELRSLIETIEKNNDSITKEALFWVMKSKVYSHYKQQRLAEKALKKALKINNNYEIRLILLMHYTETNEMSKLKELLISMESEKVDESYYFPFASAYYNLKDIDRASYYTQKLIHSDNPVTKLYEFRFMQAYIYQVQNNQEAFKSSMISIVDDLEKKAKENKNLYKEDRFLSTYLRASVNVYDSDKFKMQLKNAKKYLTKKNYDEISYSFAMKNGAVEKSNKIFHKIKKPELWLRFSNGALLQKHSEVEDLLERRLDSLSRGDAAQAAYKDGQTSLAQSIAFDILRTNNKNQNAYIQHMDLSKERSDLLDVKLFYYNRDPLVQKTLKIDNDLYIRDSYYLSTGIEHSLNDNIDTKALLYAPDTSTYMNVGLKKLFNRTFVQFDLLYSDVMSSNFGAKLEVNHRMSTDLFADIKLEKNVKAEESIAMVVAGMKDAISGNIVWRFLDSTSLDLLYRQNYFYSQDNKSVGDGYYFKAIISQLIRTSYPDIKVDLYYDKAQNNENSSSRGLIDKVQKASYTVLDHSYYNVGLNLGYGMANSRIYTRVWRPYFVFSPSYNSTADAYTYSFDLGIGGKLVHQDHLALGVKYSDSEDGLVGKTYQFYINYSFLYAHPKW